MHKTAVRAPCRSSVLRTAGGAGGVLVALLALVAATPGVASAASNGRSDAAFHPDRDWMGSTVAAHEGSSAGDGAITPMVTQTPGFDVSHWQGSINWKAAYTDGARFAYMKATEGSSYRDPSFNANYTNSYNAGFIRGAYHFARPNTSGGVTQADYFVAHGGGWSKDGKTLPPMLDIEYNPYGSTCYGLSQASMRSWITAFINEVHRKTTRWATIYTTTNWWTQCTGNTGAYAGNDPLFIARYASSPGTLPAGWGFYTFWQKADSGRYPGDQDVFNGAMTGLRNLADNA